MKSGRRWFRCYAVMVAFICAFSLVSHGKENNESWMKIAEVINKQYNQENYYEEVFFPSLQQELRYNPKLRRYRGYSIKVTDDRNVLIGGKNGGNIDFYHPWFELQYATPDDGGSWTFEYYRNYVFEEPEKGYSGKLYEHEEPYIDEDENEIMKTYWVQYIPKEKLDTSRRYMEVGTMTNDDGEIVPAYAYYKIEYKYLIKKLVFGECVERHYCDCGKFYNFGDYSPYIIVGENNRLLINQSNWIAVYDLTNNTFEYIAADELFTGIIYKKVDGDKLYYYSITDFKEYVCNWTKASTSKPTGRVMDS